MKPPETEVKADSWEAEMALNRGLSPQPQGTGGVRG